jgi:hypothetical protein
VSYTYFRGISAAAMNAAPFRWDLRPATMRRICENYPESISSGNLSHFPAKNRAPLSATGILYNKQNPKASVFFTFFSRNFEAPKTHFASCFPSYYIEGKSKAARHHI